MYNKLGASFHVFNKTGGLKLTMSSHDLEKLFDSVQRLMDSLFLKELDEIATKTYAAGSVKRNPYKSMTETVNLCCLCLLRDVLAPYNVAGNKEKPVTEVFAKEVNAFARTALQKLDAESQNIQHTSEDSSSSTISRSKLNVQAATVALQLIAWAAVDDIDSDTICSSISPRLFANQTQRVIISQLPLSLHAISSLASLAEKFPAVATATVIPILSRFLLEPAPMLTKLASDSTLERGKSAGELGKPSNGGIDGTSKRKMALDSLRNTAIKAMCRALKSAIRVEVSCVQACLASLSSKLFVCSNANNL